LFLYRCVRKPREVRDIFHIKTLGRHAREATEQGSKFKVQSAADRSADMFVGRDVNFWAKLQPATPSSVRVLSFLGRNGSRKACSKW
jgi:hypothetical protein